jgi:hypothetical protein
VFRFGSVTKKNLATLPTSGWTHFREKKTHPASREEMVDWPVAAASPSPPSPEPVRTVREPDIRGDHWSAVDRHASIRRESSWSRFDESVSAVIYGQKPYTVNFKFGLTYMALKYHKTKINCP